MSVFLFLFLSISFSPLFTAAGVGIATADCTPKCQRGPKIQFPFRIRSNQSDHCGYPGFDLDCDENGEAVLVLPSSVSLRVKKINYKTQQLHLYDPEECLALKLPNLTLSASPFQFSDWNLDHYVLFNCSSPSRGYAGPISCLSDPSYNMYAVDYSSYMDSLSLTSCTRFQNISMVPRDVFYGNDVYLKWDEPACGVCENKDQGCRFKNGTRGNETECFFRDNDHKGLSKKQKIAVASTGAFLGVLTIVAVVYLCIVIIRERENQKKVETFLEDYRGLKPTRFCYSDIRRITNEFSEKLGEGGYGVVYKGKLSKEISVAVKVLNNSKEKGEEFVNEVSTIGRIHHVNVVRLVGFCAEGFRRVLVYEFLPNDSLEKFIFQTESKRRALGLEKLQDIALGIAKGIEYLHQGCDQQILHFDIKPHNILLDQNFNPKICDFGLAKLCSKEQSGVTMTAARGTMGYIAPEVLSRTFGKVSYKSDVYSFGMLLLEMVGGRKNVDPKVNASQVYFPLWIYNHLNLGEELWTRANTEENGEGYGDGDDDGNVAKKLTIIGLSCIQWYPSDRPSMKEVVQMLEGDGSDLTMPPNPFPDGNVPNLVSGLPDKRFQIELPLILESDE